MIKKKRHERILALLRSDGMIAIAQLARLMPEVSEVTLRRDVAELAEAGALKRTRGGATLPDAALLDPARARAPHPLAGLDAVILPPVPGPGSDALRHWITRRGIPFIAESAPQRGGCYLGPDNHEAGRELGRHAGRTLSGRARLKLLMLTQPELENTRARAGGFEAGLRESFGGALELVRVNSQGQFRIALRVAQDAMAAHPDIDAVFGVNDHAALGGLEAARRRGMEVAGFATGGERDDFVERMRDAARIWGVAALHPRRVGAMALDAVAAALRGTPLPEDIVTPFTIVTPDTLEAFAHRDRVLPDPVRRGSSLAGRRVGFMPHYPAHDWYRSLGQSLASRAEALGLELVVIPPHEGIAAEVARLRGEIAETAAAMVRDGETIILGTGEAVLQMAGALRRRAAEGGFAVTVVTNALDVLERLDGAAGIRTLLTAGEYQSADRCLVGPAIGALFERMRADRAFLAVAGLTPGFGASEQDERLALAGARLREAARQTVLLADQTVIGADALHRVGRAEEIHAVITDEGALSADRQALRALGIDVITAGEEAALPAGAARS
ncbi:substrate-binding domain-containing protein [Limimaricola pyoseonensis]|uniref:DNA-binding transcriptional regulator of sugar metabolism, DeoR/GlpR family n=1 Tax=Limimaricola pyoseonensis TaxID=521013 RepID=A0A1G7HRD1_9RHOB|nr:substrate-binding domain-containing protein [Limimaricola pyoseonensis]SDF02936.1 DNA-binding transcriptional regulator of sugar metabolism, DeoR/GlpR family [Limimaricola pyoseonensis]